jgi:hypothetical protein
MRDRLDEATTRLVLAGFPSPTSTHSPVDDPFRFHNDPLTFPLADLTWVRGGLKGERGWTTIR